MSKSISLNIETQTEKGEVISLCHVNEKMLALEVSYAANKLFKLNRKLFDKINKTTKIKSGVLYRQEVLRETGNTNQVYGKIDNSYFFKEIEIGRLFFENNVLRKQKRAVNNKGRKFDFDPEQVSDENSGGLFNEDSLSPDDISASKIISTIEEIWLFQDQGIKSFLIIDHLSDKSNLLEAGYRITLSVQDSFSEYVNFVVSQAEKSVLFLDRYLSSLNLKNNYDGLEGKFNKSFANRILLDLGIDPKAKKINLSSSRIKNSDFGKAAIACYNLTSLVASSVEKNSMYYSIITGLLPTEKTTPDNISLFLYNLRTLLENVRKQYFQTVHKQGKKRNFLEFPKESCTPM